MSTPDDDHDARPGAEALYAEYLERRSAEALTFEAFLAEHPRYAAALSALSSFRTSIRSTAPIAAAIQCAADSSSAAEDGDVRLSSSDRMESRSSPA